MGIFCRDYIASHSKQNHQAPENEHQEEKSNRPRNKPRTVEYIKKDKSNFLTDTNQRKGTPGNNPQGAM